MTTFDRKPESAISFAEIVAKQNTLTLSMYFGFAPLELRFVLKLVGASSTIQAAIAYTSWTPIASLRAQEQYNHSSLETLMVAVMICYRRNCPDSDHDYGSSLP